MIGVEIRGSEGRGLGVFALCPFATGEGIRFVNIVREVTEKQPLGPEDNPDQMASCCWWASLIGI